MTMKQRRNFIHYFFNASGKFRYAIIKDIYKDIYNLPESADIDLVVAQDDLQDFLDIINNGEHVVKVGIEKKAFALFVKIYFEDLGYLEIDLIHRFDRKGIVYLEALDVLEHSVINEQGLKAAALHHQFIYTVLFYMLNKFDVPDRYRKYFSEWNAEERRTVFGWLTAKYDVHINTLDDLYEYHNRHRKKLLLCISNDRQNRVLLKWKHRLEYLIDTARGVTTEKGITVTFTGVDGAGKSTILESVKKQLESRYRQRVKVLRHRPSLFPILSSIRHGKTAAEQKAAASLPRQGTNNNILSSLFRFSYYFADYILGRPYVYFKYNSRGIIVLYDRYYFDFIVDGRRSNINIRPAIVKKGYSLVSKPEVNVFLYAAPGEILKRKQELNEADIRTMTSDYRDLFESLSEEYPKQQYISLDNKDLNTTIETVMKHIISAH
jgi:thymidylate kinase